MVLMLIRRKRLRLWAAAHHPDHQDGNWDPPSLLRDVPPRRMVALGWLDPVCVQSDRLPPHYTPPQYPPLLLPDPRRLRTVVVIIGS